MIKYLENVLMLVGDDGGKRSGVHDRAEIPLENLPCAINLNMIREAFQIKKSKCILFPKKKKRGGGGGGQPQS